MSTAADRAVVNVATGPYVALQKRLAASVRGARFAGWTDALPPGSPPHDDAPYGFKLFALREAERRGARSGLWLDAPCVVRGDLRPVFERIERDGVLLVTAGERLGNWAGDGCLAAFSISRDAAMDLPLMNGTLIGVDFRRPAARMWLEGLEVACRRGLFRGPDLSWHAPVAVRRARAGKRVGFVSRDRRCWGHRHDEAVGSCLANRLALALSPQGEFLGPDAPVAHQGGR